MTLYPELRRHLLSIGATDLVRRLAAVDLALRDELGAEPAAAAGGTVLLVDDEPAVLFLMTEFLDGEGYRLVTARHGKEAQAILRDGPDRFDAIVIDRVMPQMGGIAVLRWLQTEPSLAAVPVILQSGAEDFDEAAEGFAAGAWFHLFKPYDMDLFRALLRLAVRRG